MPILTPTFNFDGQCEEAIALYQKAFGANIGYLLHYADALPEDYDTPLSEWQKSRVYHAEIFIGAHRIMMCDNFDIPFAPSPSSSLTVTFDTKEEVLRAYEALKEGCTILNPVHSTTYSSCIVVLMDKFGFRWGLMTEQTER